VKSIDVDLGSRVAKGTLMARIASTGMGEAQSAYLKALADEELRGKTLDRQRQLRASGIVAANDLEEAEAAYKSARAATAQARQHLGVLGLSEAQIQGLASDQGAPGEIEIRAPFAGEVVDRAAVPGTSVEEGQTLFTVADTGTMWAMVDIPESQLRRVRVGQRVHVTVPSLPDRTFTGTLTWLPASVDERTRMARGRVEVPNDGRLLKARMYGRAVILTTAPSRAVVVPRSAVERVGDTTVVFVQSEADVFEARAVRLGPTRGGVVEVFEGLRADEPIVVAGAFTLKSQLLISRLGAGCVD
jgi:cobalt-zinc-cadmium efflux system membrane fusion protein